ncbi:hypothetical protein IV203_029470 [Nitzschia inconspicua]|uniref:Uncharacterized protein n=1 Tax=Nitzschia inconspicua TaxID=303405 RepID=A0A9K3LQN7_9STRA|nr:hypothetical protein IV203_029470 [Nitzschia inconspicua]
MSCSSSLLSQHEQVGTMKPLQAASLYHDEETTPSAVQWSLFSCFRNNDDLGSVDEVTKPLYYIVEEVSSQEVKDFARNNKGKSYLTNQRRRQITERPCARTGFCQKISGLLNNGPRRRRDSETASITRVESGTVLNEKGTNQSLTSRRLNMPVERLSFKPIKRPFTNLSQKMKSLTIAKPFSRSVGERVMRNGYSCLNADDSFDMSVEPNELGSPVNLGVRFPHPAFAGVTEDLFWKGVSPGRGAGGREYAKANNNPSLPYSRTVFDVTTAHSDDSQGSFPTDECDDTCGERMEDEFEYDFEDLPFDEATFDGVTQRGSLESESYCNTSYYFRSHDDDYDDDDNTFGDGSPTWIDRYDTRPQSAIYSPSRDTIRNTWY